MNLMNPTVRRGAVILLWLGAVQAWAAAQPQAVIHRFDCGTADSPLREGWTRITHEDVYSAEKSYGWTRPAAQSFDRTKLFMPDWYRHEVKTPPPLDPVTRDGVQDPGELIFRVDVPEGDYWVVVYLGDEAVDRWEMTVHANGVPLAVKTNTQTSWGGFATARPFRVKVPAKDGRIEISFTHNHELNSVLGIEVVSHVPCPIRFEDRQWRSSDPDAHLAEGLKRLNAGEWQAAVAAFEKIENPVLKVAALLSAADLLEMPEAQANPLVERAVALAEEWLRKNPAATREAALVHELWRHGSNYLRVRQYLTMLAYERAKQATGLVAARRMDMANDLCLTVKPEDPLYHRAVLNLERIHYWADRETRREPHATLAKQYIDILKTRQPNARLVRIYGGEKIPWGEALSREGFEHMPEWALVQREAMNRLLTVIRWWIENRQLDNGEMGGGYGDDPEMLRQWHVFLGAADDAVVRRGWLKLAHGIWFSDMMENGFHRDVGDVQHTAEPTSDTVPSLIFMDYGNPVWIERAMETMRLMRDVWTGINAHGHRHFKSASIGAKGVDAQPPWGVDVPMNARATRPGLALGWYNRHPAILQMFREWIEAWMDDTLREGDGKPAGVMPAAITYAEDKLGGYGKAWHDPEIYWTYFKWDAFYHLHKMYDHMLAMYVWTGEVQYLEPIWVAMRLADEWAAGPGGDPATGTREWAAKLLYENMAPTVEKYRAMTGRTEYDDYLRKQGSGYMRFLLTGSQQPLIQHGRAVIRRMSNNFELATEEVLFTDRVPVTQDPMWAMYTGGVSEPYHYPSYHVTWSGTGANFACLVTAADVRSLRLTVCNFDPADRSVGMNLLRLEPGEYELSAGPDADNDDKADSIARQQRFTVRRAPCRLELPLQGKGVQVVEIRQVAKAERIDFDGPDLAIGDQDIQVGMTAAESERFRGWFLPDQVIDVAKGKAVPVTVVVHNVGSRSTLPAVVKLRERRDGRLRDVAQSPVRPIQPPNDLTPQRVRVQMEWTPEEAGAAELVATLESDGLHSDTNPENHQTVRRVRVR